MIKNLKTYKSLEDFTKVYSIFKEYPFFEKWNDKLIKEEYEYLMDNGDVYGYYISNNMTGLLSVLYGKQESHPVIFNEDEKIMYISDIAVLDEYRGRGIGTKLFNKAVDEALKDSYDYMYLRTNLKGSMSEGIAKRFGFSDMYKNNKIIVQDCFFERTKDDLQTMDKRKFLCRKMK